jgi:exodeoxyribonuclease III
MRIVVWNCNMALHGKWERLLALQPDIAIIPECANPEILRAKAPAFAFGHCEWEGLLEHKGLGVLAFGDYSLSRHPSFTANYRFFIPVEVHGPRAFNLLAVCAMNEATPPEAVVNPGSIAKAITHYGAFLGAGPALMAGDFNANTRWDKGARAGNHAQTIAALEARGLASAYHTCSGAAAGAEPDSTIFWTKNRQAGYHIDYCFAPRAWLGKESRVTVGRPEEWLAVSDHMPMVVELEPGM